MFGTKLAQAPSLGPKTLKIWNIDFLPFSSLPHLSKELDN